MKFQVFKLNVSIMHLIIILLSCIPHIIKFMFRRNTIVGNDAERQSIRLVPRGPAKSKWKQALLKSPTVGDKIEKID